MLLGTASPWLDYQPLVAKLEQDHRVVVVEPFGYSLSDQTDVPRTTQNIVEEVQEEVLDIAWLHSDGIVESDESSMEDYTEIPPVIGHHRVVFLVWD